MENQETLPGLEPTVDDRAVSALMLGLRDYGVVDGLQVPRAGHEEAVALLSYLREAGVLLSDPPVRTAVSISLVRTCMAMPEQYDVFRNGRQIGYLRLRHGYFRVHYTDSTAQPPVVYETAVRGDGCFYDDEERARELKAAAIALLQADGVENPDPVFEIPPYEEDDDWDDFGLLEELAQKSAAIRASELELFREDLWSQLQEALAAGLDVDGVMELLRDGEFLADSAPKGYGADRSIG